MAGTKVIKCKCESQFQDETYGKGMRLHSVSADKTKAHCTVCEGSGKNAKRTSKPGNVATTRPHKNI